MKVNYVKFFQHVELPVKNGGQTLYNYARDKDYDITLDGIMIYIRPLGGGNEDMIITTLNNVQFMKVDHESIDAKTEKSSAPASSKKKEQTQPKD